ncbi:uncharacterized protein LOC107884470 isoform X2 [Acyrthosiphon pisum]|uniref:Uncharacterized protein n=1 Tax=Acyrthosiphon pisum TaxID=7029 RepID=A0A8R2NRC7_ACYPI|nr:uncharacterized protein LOC107884470 isoform X2 [Acyrthosiphon pisum]
MISYFEELKSSDLNANRNNLIFKCILCGSKEKYISTSKLSNSNLKTHIKIKHPNDLAEFNNCMKKRPTYSTTMSHKQLKLSEHPAFVNYCKVTSNKVPASCRSLMRDVEYLYNKMIHEMISELDTVKYVCITADCWSIFHKSYIGFTIHWINPQMLERCSKGLACRRMIGRHTYDNIAESIDKVLDEFKIQNKTTLIVTGNAANFVKTFRIYSNDNDNDLNECIGESEENEVSIEITNTLEGELSDVDNLISISLPPHQRCAAHTMNLIASVDIKDAEKDLAYRTISHKVFKKCQGIFNKQNQSTLSADIIKNHLGRYLITPNATRWNSYYDAMKCILENIDKIEDVCNDLQLTTISGPREISFLQEYCNVMKPISRALDILQDDKNVSLGY